MEQGVSEARMQMTKEMWMRHLDIYLAVVAE